MFPMAYPQLAVTRAPHPEYTYALLSFDRITYNNKYSNSATLFDCKAA